MSITNYSELKTAVAAWLHRADLDDRIPDFIQIGEGKLSRDLDSRRMDVKADLVTTPGDKALDLPADMLEMRRLQIVSDDYNTPLQYRTPDEIAADYPHNRTGRPVVFTVIGQRLELAPIPDAAYNLELNYIQRLPALSDSNPTNWLLSAWPSAYLYAALCAAQPFLINDERLPMFERLYNDVVAGISGINWYSGSTMRVIAR